jgi:hypothetical protein
MLALFGRNVRRSSIVLGLALGALTPAALAVTPVDPGPADVLFSIDATQTARPISPYIYGMNFFNNSSLTNPVTLDRLGGNRWTGYNWETNASNAGADYYHHSDYHLTGGQANTPPGEAVRPALVSASANNRGLVVTVPIAGYVSADANGTVDATEVAPSSRWHEVAPNKSTVYPGSSLSLTPNESDDYVFTDEFVNWVEQTRVQQRNPPEVFYSLDNEPALWGETLPTGWQSGVENVQDPSSGGRTHPLIHPYAPTFAEMRDKTIAHAGAIKDAAPDALVFGGVSYGYAEFTRLQEASDFDPMPSHPGGDSNGELHYLEWLLNEVHQEEQTQGRKLMDVLDVHWYPEAQGGGVRVTENNNSAAVVAARVQAPRSLWDPTYTETSWITNCCSGGPIQLLNHLQRDVDDFNPGTKLAITEYNYGGTNHISGGVAQADVLGIFGREELFAATFWNLHDDNQSQFASGAFKMYLDYDGEGGQFGDLSLVAETDDLAQSAVYASLDSTDPTRMIVVAINRTNSPLDTALAITDDRVFDLAEVYQLTAASPNPVQAADLEIDLLNAFHYTMPAMSVSTLVLHAVTNPADFDGDGFVDGDDLAQWEQAFGLTAAGDANSDGATNGRDALVWLREFTGNTPTPLSVPEPISLVQLLCSFCFAHTLWHRK